MEINLNHTRFLFRYVIDDSMQIDCSPKQKLRKIVVFVLMVFSLNTLAFGKPIPLDEDHWEFERDAQFVTKDGVDTIHLNGSMYDPGVATIKGLDFQDGSIEFDMWIDDYEHAAFVGLQIRYDEATERWEDVYFRPDSNHQYDAFQYFPRYAKVNDPWELYGEYQRALDFPCGEWFHFKIDLKGYTMTCTFGDQDYPFFVTDRLSCGSEHGAIRFVSSSDVYLKDVHIKPRKARKMPAFDPVKMNLDPRYLTKWKVSQAIPLEDGDMSLDLERFAVSTEWKELYAEDKGMINFTRNIEMPSKNCAVLAQVPLFSDSEQTKKLRIGYSDRMDLYLNGELVYSGDNTFMTENARMRGRLHEGKDTVALHLKQGENIIQAIVYERFGGWAMIARLSNNEGVSFPK